MSLIGHATHYFEGLWSSGSELRNGGPAFGVLQRCSRSSRIVAACLLIAAVTLTKSLAVLTCIYLVCAIGALLSFIEIRRYLGRNLVIVCGLALPMAVFGSLAIVTPGVTFLRIGRVHFTHQGVRNVAFVVMRSLDAVSITMLLARSCGIHGIIKGLREMGLPAELTAALQMAVAHMHSLGRMAAVSYTHLTLPTIYSV